MKLTLPDKSIRELEAGSNGFDLAKDIGPGLAKAAVAININGEQRDLSEQLPDVVTKLQEKLSNFLESVDAEKPKDAYNWKTTGKSGEGRTKFFERYK